MSLGNARVNPSNSANPSPNPSPNPVPNPNPNPNPVPNPNPNPNRWVEVTSVGVRCTANVGVRDMAFEGNEKLTSTLHWL